MISNWQKFNESSEPLTKEMVHDIIFYFGENCMHNNTDIIEIEFDMIY